jgi:hypothetical protein
MTWTPEPSALTPAEQRFGEHRRVGVRVVTADDDDRVEVVLDAGLAHLRELLRRLDLRPVRAEEVEAAGVEDEVDVGVGDLEQRALEQALGSGLDAEQRVAGAEDALEAADDVVAAGRRPAGKEDGDALAGHARGAGASRAEDDVAGSGDGLRELRANAVGILGAKDLAGVAEADRLRVVGRAEGGTDRQRVLAHGRLENRAVRFGVEELFYEGTHALTSMSRGVVTWLPAPGRRSGPVGGGCGLRVGERGRHKNGPVHLWTSPLSCHAADYPSVPTLFRSANACFRRARKASSPLRSQARGS